MRLFASLKLLFHLFLFHLLMELLFSDPRANRFLPGSIQDLLVGEECWCRSSFLTGWRSQRRIARSEPSALKSSRKEFSLEWSQLKRQSSVWSFTENNFYFFVQVMFCYTTSFVTSFCFKIKLITIFFMSSLFYEYHTFFTWS